MAEPTFQIVFRGKILGGFDREQVRANLVQLFRSDPARIDALLDAPKTVLKSGLTRDAAARYQDALRQAGIMVAVIGESPAEIQPVPSSAPEAAAPVEHVAPPPVPEPPSGLTLAEPGAALLPPRERVKADIDTSAMSLAEPGVVLIEHRPHPRPEYDLSALDLSPVGDPIDMTPRAAPLEVDTSAFSLSEQPEEAEAPPTELQKLLSSPVD